MHTLISNIQAKINFTFLIPVHVSFLESFLAPFYQLADQSAYLLQDYFVLLELTLRIILQKKVLYQFSNDTF